MSHVLVNVYFVPDRDLSRPNKYYMYKYQNVMLVLWKKDVSLLKGYLFAWDQSGLLFPSKY